MICAVSGLSFLPNQLASGAISRKRFTDTKATVFRSVNGTPVANLDNVIEQMGGIEKLIGKNDIVVVKPNVQWWNQGATNISALNRVVELIFQQFPGFQGEVIITENIHHGKEPWEHGGWARSFERNVEAEHLLNYNDLAASLKNTYGNQFSVVHLINAKGGGRRVYSPSEGFGYVYCDGTNGADLIKFDNGASGDLYREVIMTYPIMVTDKGTVIDFKSGIWENGAYTQQPLKFINFSALNHHSYWCSITSSVKNYLGISDLSGGADPHNDGKLTEKYFNFHSFPFDKWSPGPVPGMIGAEIGVFMNTIRKADLNIATQSG